MGGGGWSSIVMQCGRGSSRCVSITRVWWCGCIEEMRLSPAMRSWTLHKSEVVIKSVTKWAGLFGWRSDSSIPLDLACYCSYKQSYYCIISTLQPHTTVTYTAPPFPSLPFLLFLRLLLQSLLSSFFLLLSHTIQTQAAAVIRHTHRHI